MGAFKGWGKKGWEKEELEKRWRGGKKDEGWEKEV